MARSRSLNPTHLSAAESRAIALRAQGFGKPVGKTATMPSCTAAINRMGLLQIDSVNVLCRSHYLPVFSRVGTYDRAGLDALTHGRASRTFFEDWAHEASFLPMADYPLFWWKRNRARDGEGLWRSVRAFAMAEQAYVARVLREITARGPVTGGDLSDPGERSGQWWGWSKGKTALEYLFASGALAIAGRGPTFERFYDVPERVIPAALLNQPVPAAPDALRTLVAKSALACGIATEADLRDYYRLPLAETRLAIAELLEAGDLVPATVEGWDKPAFLHTLAKGPAAMESMALLSPFDPLVWNRPRAQRLFGFSYKLEIYTPAAKRIHGYYVLPFLLGDRLVARVCLKADRANRTLRVNAAHGEAGVMLADSAGPLRATLEKMAAWLGLDEIAWSGSGPLDQTLKNGL